MTHASGSPAAAHLRRSWSDELGEWRRKLDEAARQPGRSDDETWAGLQARAAELEHRLRHLGDDAGPEWGRMREDLQRLEADLKHALGSHRQSAVGCGTGSAALHRGSNPRSGGRTTVCHTAS